ncbi:MAG: hypothetical protein JXR48_02470 [Candidatus Delongbacteria bacterium]|nr:hypothetical protein [Candidatus Delongbacteria bacterium]MBN2833811.1 hypothetical protein [Candidatus Delongbacteria bacterium]
MKRKIIYFLFLLIAVSSLKSETVRKYSEFTLAKGDTLHANLIVYNNDAIIEGYLDGDLSVYLGDIKINEGKVEGRTKCFGGRVYKDGELYEKDSNYLISVDRYIPLMDEDSDEEIDFDDEATDVDIDIDVDLDENDLKEFRKSGRKNWKISLKSRRSHDGKYYTDLNDVRIDDPFEIGNDSQNALAFRKFHYNKDLVPKALFDYSKVGGVYAGLSGLFDNVISYNDTDKFDSYVFVRGGYFFENEEWEYHSAEVLSFYNHIFSIGADQYRSSATPDMWKLDHRLNSLGAVLLREDLYNYHMREGLGANASFFLQWGSENSSMNSFNIRGGYRSDKITAFDGNDVNWSLFGGNKKFSRNYAVEEGNLNFLTYDAEYKIGIDAINTNFGLAANYEKTVDCNDYNYKAFTGESFLELKLFDVLTFKNMSRFVSVSTEAPSFKMFSIGGTGTLPGYNYNEFSGNRGYLSRTEVSAPLRDLFSNIVFLFDIGDTWYYDSDKLFAGFEDRSIDDIKSSFGVGFKISDDFIVSLHRRLDTSDDPYQIQFSLITDFSLFNYRSFGIIID